MTKKGLTPPQDAPSVNSVWWYEEFHDLVKVKDVYPKIQGMRVNWYITFIFCTRKEYLEKAHRIRYDEFYSNFRNPTETEYGIYLLKQQGLKYDK